MLEFFPSYAPTQFAAGGAFHHQALVTMIGLSLAWMAAFALLGMVILRLRLPGAAGRSRAPPVGQLPPRRARGQPAGRAR
jgi:hypothetical protein